MAEGDCAQKEMVELKCILCEVEMVVRKKKQEWGTENAEQYVGTRKGRQRGLR